MTFDIFFKDFVTSVIQIPSFLWVFHEQMNPEKLLRVKA